MALIVISTAFFLPEIIRSTTEPRIGKRHLGALREIDEQTKKDKGGLIGSTMVSDAFFPYRDGVDVGIKEGISTIVQPGGSDRDFEFIQACNEVYLKVTMAFTAQQVF
jgi:phosphoribosylaminoimidazolecarboxamide formyltransferase / IMP cyclohydrolase